MLGKYLTLGRQFVSFGVRGMATNARSQKLSGKVAIVTASTEGIGYAIAKRLAEDGASVVISSRKENNVNEALKNLQAAGLDVCGRVCHVGKEEDRLSLIDYAVKEKGGIDILVSNAAVNPVMGSLLDTPGDAWDKIFEINVKCAFLLTKETVPHMIKRGGGSVVFVSSIGGYRPLPAIGAYCVSKTALLGLTKVLAQEVASDNIRVNCVCPGIIKTKFSSALWTDPAAQEESEQLIPLGRIGQPDEMSGLVSFLASDDASYLTGESIANAGGYYSRL